MKHVLIVIGGASRSGKSTLAALLGTRLGYDVFELDAVYDAISSVVAAWQAPADALVEDLMRSSALSVVDTIARQALSLIVEGGWIEPEHASILKQRYPNHHVVLVYLGFPELDIEFAINKMRMHASWKDWVWPKSRKLKRRFFAQQIAGSHWYREQCALHSLEFINTSHDRPATIERAADDIVKTLKQRAD